MISSILLSVETTLLLSVAALYIVHCPFNKVEESFNTQAVHDVINIFPDKLPFQDAEATTSHQEVAFRTSLPWDHTQYPGVVPRTFIGALLIGLPLKLAKYLMESGILMDNTESDGEADLTTQFVLQICSRFVLASLIALSISAITRAIHKRYGLLFRICFLLATVTQFHYMYYAGRFLPNTFACILSNLVFASWINRHYSLSIIYIAFCVVIFRFDTAIFFGWLLLDSIFIKGYLSLGRVLKIGIPAGLVALSATVLVDSLFWNKLVWPEGSGLYFNLWLNKSHEWGTAPYFWYIYSCIPRITLAGAPLILLAEHKVTRDYLLPTIAFILTYSYLPHKELRFILFITPLLNICLTSGLMNVYHYLNKLFLYLHSKTRKPADKKNHREEGEEKRSLIASFVFIFILLGMCSANIFACYITSRISSLNYPGGQAAISLGVTKEILDRAQKVVNSDAGIRDIRSDTGVYVNNLAAQSGVSRFTQVNGVFYSKTPNLDSSSFRNSYKLIYLLLEPKEVTTFLKSYCPLDDNISPDKWKKSHTEVKCAIPNQSQMFCSIHDSVNSFKSINIGGLIRKLKQVDSVESAKSSVDDVNFIKTKTALHIIRCGVRSVYNPIP